MRPYLIISLIAAVFFLPFLGEVHLFDWDEINFAEASREMIVTGDYLKVHIDFQAFWEKPPFFFWLQVIAMKTFGINEYAARFPNAICGIFSLLFIFSIGRKLYNDKFAWLWVLVYLGTLLPHLYFKSGIIDPWFNLFIFASLYFFILFFWKKEDNQSLALFQSKWAYLSYSGLLMGLAILTKGPAALLIMGLCLFVFWVFQKFRIYVPIPSFLFWCLVVLLLPMGWFGFETLKNGPWFVQTFLTYQIRLFSTPDAGHGGFFAYHFVVLLFGCFPASFFAIRSFFKLPKSNLDFQDNFNLWMKILFWVVLILFSIVKSKIVHYSSLSYFPLTFLASLVIYHIIQKNISFSVWIKAGLLFVGGLFAAIFIAAPQILSKSDIASYTDDPFVSGNLEANILWTGWEVIPGLVLLLVLAVGFYSFKKKTNWNSFYGFFIGTAIFINVSILFYVKRVEGYSQRAAIEFLKSKSQEDCYVIPYGYKSYAHLFYTQKQKPENENSYDKNWLLRGAIDKDVYVVTKIHKAGGLGNIPGLEEVGRKNGFVFFKRAFKE